MEVEGAWNLCGMGSAGIRVSVCVLVLVVVLVVVLV